MLREPVELPSPGVAFGPDFLARLGGLLARLAGQRERLEGDGHGRLFGVGSEFVGYRPYRPGEDLRALDWSLLARLGRPYVRVSAREASEEWALWLDTSASMGVGVPGKLQLAAELTAALAALALARKARVELVLSGSGRRLTIAKRAALGPWLSALEGLRAEGSDGLGALTRRLGGERGGGRLFLIGDFLDAEPQEVLRLARPSREMFLAQVFAREELVPLPQGAVRWIDAETGAARELHVDGGCVKSYERRMGARLERWRRAAGRARASYGCWTSDQPFETLVRDLCGGGG